MVSCPKVQATAMADSAWTVKTSNNRQYLSISTIINPPLGNLVKIQSHSLSYSISVLINLFVLYNILRKRLVIKNQTTEAV